MQTLIKSIILLLFLPSLAYAWSDSELCQAIFQAEGGLKAQYAYGIRSVRYKDLAEARRICLNTIHNQRIRHNKHSCGLSYLECLANRYCPTKGKLSKAEHKLNKNWIKLVTYFLKKGETK